MIRISDLRAPLDMPPLKALAARALHIPESAVRSVRLLKKSVDARDKSDVHFVLTLEADAAVQPSRLPRNASIVRPEAPKPARVPHPVHTRPLVVGMGPAGLFCALTLAQNGLKPVVIERGRDVDTRTADVERFWQGGALDEKSNVQYGEGGAGTFSDGKLTTGIKDPRIRTVLETFVRFGAPEEILYLAKPHIGTDILQNIVRSMRGEILRLGGTVLFETQLTGLVTENGSVVGAEVVSNDESRVIPTDAVILAIGHSARDTFRMLQSSGVSMEQKAFSMGVRIEHRQKDIDAGQYGPAAGHPALGAADYKVNVSLKNGRGVYTFCMCPGGHVVAAASKAGTVVTNGMSYHARNAENANAAVLVGVTPEDFGSSDVLAGVALQEIWEQAAFIAGGSDYRAPAQLVGDLLRDVPSKAGGRIRPSYRPGVHWTTLKTCLPPYIYDSLQEAIPLLGRRIRGFDDPEAVLTGIESRSSSPVRILRGKDLVSVSTPGLYPCGEGAGYAGGITSAAVDGIKIAEAILYPTEE